MSEVHGKVWWSELMTGDLAVSRGYYEALCGWTFETMPMGDGEYHLAKMGDVPVAGMTTLESAKGMMPNTLPHWFTYFAVDDVDVAVDTTRERGGAVHSEPFDVPGVGRIAIVEDPTGAAVGIMTPVLDVPS